MKLLTFIFLCLFFSGSADATGVPSTYFLPSEEPGKLGLFIELKPNQNFMTLDLTGDQAISCDGIFEWHDNTVRLTYKSCGLTVVVVDANSALQIGINPASRQDSDLVQDYPLKNMGYVRMFESRLKLAYDTISVEKQIKR